MRPASGVPVHGFAPVVVQPRRVAVLVVSYVRLAVMVLVSGADHGWKIMPMVVLPLTIVNTLSLGTVVCATERAV
jgi:hypothetical protein